MRTGPEKAARWGGAEGGEGQEMGGVGEGPG